jgi:hypothetical protein
VKDIVQMALIHMPKLKKESNIVISSNSQSIEDCKVLLYSLPEGIYCMDWEGPFPRFQIPDHNDTDSGIIEITIRSKFRFKEMLQIKKPSVGKKIEICDSDISCIDSWTEEQVSQLITRLEDIINGTYYC